MMRSRAGVVFGIVAAGALSQSAGAQREHPVREHPVRWTERAVPPSAGVGKTQHIELHASIAEFFHLYSTTQPAGGPVRTSVAVLAEKPGVQAWVLAEPVRGRSPDTIPDANFGIMTEVYDDSVTLDVAVRPVNQAAAPPIRLGVRYQACTARYCLPERVDTVMVAGIGAASATPDVQPGETVLPVTTATTVPTVPTFGGSSGVGAFLLLAASMGALALLTPCVLPMIPLLVTSFAGPDVAFRERLKRAGSYALGMVGTFTAGGTLAAAVFGASGLARFAAHPAVNIVIAVLFVLFALSLAGVMPHPFTSFIPRSAARRLGTTTIAPMAVGALFTLTALTCTAPLIGTLLVLSSQGTWRWPLAGMAVFSAVFASPFVVLSLVPRLIGRGPRAGEWMPALTLTLAAFELGAALKFLSNADMVLGWSMLTRGALIGSWIVLLIGLAIALIWRRRPSDGRARTVLAMLALACAAAISPGLLGHRIGELESFLPPRVSTLATADDIPWMLNDYEGALATAARDGRPVLVDFTGYTCTNCRWMEANMFPRREVRDALSRFVRIRLYTDGRGEPFRSQQMLEQQVFGTVALPLYAIVAPGGRPVATFLGMTRNSREFVAFLDAGTRTP